ncbi:hypothetical protein [Desulfogranum japonicum]|uniref:hypothetical protein n=1 Tax=Desulfogranum japonicum TaxID=231447 RepID=UPI0004297022|nr:hypothetical protein [Desulfogranum japonicum]
MSDPRAAMLQMLQTGGLAPTYVAGNSRYSGIDIATLETDQEEPVSYFRRRFCPQPEDLALLNEHQVVQGDRLDNLAAQYIGDPEQFWQICDANCAMEPEELLEQIGRRLRITLPQGVPGGNGA